MGYHIDSLDMCFGIQLMDSRCDIGVIYAQELMHVLVFCFSGRNLGALFEFLCVGLSIMNLKLFGVILVRTLGQINQKEQLRGGFVPYKQFILMFSARQELWSDSSSHVEGWLYDPIILPLLRDCTSESTDPRPHFQALQYRLCSLLLLATLLFFIVTITKINIYHHYYTCITISSLNQSTYTIYHCIWCVGDTRDFLLFGCRVV